MYLYLPQMQGSKFVYYNCVDPLFDLVNAALYGQKTAWAETQSEKKKGMKAKGERTDQSVLREHNAHVRNTRPLTTISPLLTRQ